MLVTCSVASAHFDLIEIGSANRAKHKFQQIVIMEAVLLINVHEKCIFLSNSLMHAVGPLRLGRHGVFNGRQPLTTVPAARHLDGRFSRPDAQRLHGMP